MRTVGCCCSCSTSGGATGGGGAAASRSGRANVRSSIDGGRALSLSKTRIPPRSIGARRPSPSSSAALSPAVPPCRRPPSLAMPSQHSSQLSSVVTKARSSRRASEGEEPYPFDEREFVRVIPAVVARSSRDPTRGIVVFAQITDADADDPEAGVSGIGARGDGATLHDGAAALSMEIGGDGLLALLLMGARSAAQSERRERRAEERARKRREREREKKKRRSGGFGGFFGGSQQFEDEEEEEEEEDDETDFEDDEIDDDDDDDESSSGVPPLALDLLWKVLARGRRLSRREWTLVRVAVVDVDEGRGHGGAFVARLFFGGKGLPTSSSSNSSSSSSSAASTEPVVTWETRARPSEAAWLAHRFDAPLFVRRDIFAARSSPLGELLKEVDAALDNMGDSDDDDSDDEDEDEYEDDDSDDDHEDDDSDDGEEIEDSLFYDSDDIEEERRRRRRRRRRRKQQRQRDSAAAAAAAAPVPFSSMSSTPLPSLAMLAPGDPAPVVLLKRQLAVALSEEDYSSASAIRDHPLLAAYNRAEEAEAKGDAPAAAAAAADLARLLRAGEEREAEIAEEEEEEEKEKDEEEQEEEAGGSCAEEEEEEGARAKGAKRGKASSPRAAASSSASGRGGGRGGGRASSVRGGGRGGRGGGGAGRGSAAAKRPPSSPPPPASGDDDDSSKL